jgi:hypothetical protein
MQRASTPELRLSASGGRCRLSLGGLTYADGDTLQEAADHLVARLLNIAMSLDSGFTITAEAPGPDLSGLDFLWELREIAARGGDIRERIFAT